MAKVDFRRVNTNTEVENLDIKDGQFIVTGEGKTFVDFGNERKSIAGTPDTQMSNTSTNSVENKIIKGYVDNVKNELETQINSIGTQITSFGDILTTDGTYTANFYAKVVGTKVGNKLWKLEIEGQILNNNAGGNYYQWGISIDKINTLLDLNLDNYTNTQQASSYNLFTSTGTLDLTVNGISTLFEYIQSLNALLPARYYNSSGSTGGWSLSQFSNSSILKAILYLEESE